MSLDLYMVIKDCVHCGHKDVTEDLNITYNVHPMWHIIFPKDKRMIDIDGLRGDVAEVDLSIALYNLKKTPKKFIALNPVNGWGSYTHLVEYIEKLIKLCKEYPDGIWHSSR